MNKYLNCINYLIQKKTNFIPHSKSNFMNHLIGTYNILREWKCDEHICFAGLLHAIYGNESFKNKIETDRKIIKNLVGEKAEELIYIYNKDRYAIKEVSIIAFANQLEQDFIFIEDNIYDKQDTDEFYFYFRDKAPWNFTGTGGDHRFWRKFIYDLSFDNDIEKKLKKITEDLLKQYKIFNFLKQERVYASANPFGTVHESHTDYINGLANGITVMYYLNNTWDIQNGGETIFLNNIKNEITKSVIPKPSRIILFNGNIPHAARDVARNVVDLRMVLTFKYNIQI
jgi:hypothetical protein